jgi:hypothetical protein
MRPNNELFRENSVTTFSLLDYEFNRADGRLHEASAACRQSLLNHHHYTQKVFYLLCSEQILPSFNVSSARLVRIIKQKLSLNSTNH